MFKLCGNKKSDYVIIYKQYPSKSLRTAVLQLKEYIFKISGVTLCDFVDSGEAHAHEIVVGFTKRGGYTEEEREKLGDEGFIIRTVSEKIFIIGSEVRGALYGVYTFLEKCCSCRFYTQDFEKIPRRDTIIIDDIDDCEIPVFEYRNVYWNCLIDEKISAKLKINGCEPRKISEKFGGGISYTGGFVHTMGYLTGRCAEGEADWSQPCLTDPAVYDKILDTVRTHLRTHPDAKIISISQNDGNGGACKCERCRAIDEAEESEMGTLLTVVNRIADELRGEFPDVLFDTLAYRFTRRPPKNLKPRDNVIIRLCSIECCFRHPLCECDETPGHEEVRDKFSDNLRDWSHLTDHLYIWDYTTNFTNFTQPYANFAVLLPNLRYFADNNVRGMFEQGNIHCPNGEFAELRAYLLAKAMWNPYMTDEEFASHAADFLRDYYGDGGRFIGQYLQMMIDGSHDSHFGIYYDNPGLYVWCRDCESHIEGELEFMRRGKELFERAASAVCDDVISANIERSSIQLCNYIFFALDDYRKTLTDENEIAKVDEMIIENNKRHFELIKKYNITSTMEFVYLTNVTDPDFTKPALLWRDGE